GENLNDEFESVPNLAQLGQLDSEMMLVSDNTSADSGEDEESTATNSAIAIFSYAHYTDLEQVKEMLEVSVGSDSTVPRVSGDCCWTPSLLYSSSMDPELIEAEVEWVLTQLAAFTFPEKTFQVGETRLEVVVAKEDQFGKL
ncbi:hypothetical protein HDU80_003173, partial [Chytriomyces hyalinus]